MKVRSSIKKICGFCIIFKRKKRLSIRCINAKHKQRQFS